MNCAGSPENSTLVVSVAIHLHLERETNGWPHNAFCKTEMCPCGFLSARGQSSLGMDVPQFMDFEMYVVFIYKSNIFIS